MWISEEFHPKTQDLIRAFHTKGKIIATVCVAAFALAESGILKGKRATVYHLDHGKTQQELAEYGVNVINEPIVVDNNIITSYCPETAAGVAYQLLEMLIGKKKMNEVKHAMGYEKEKSDKMKKIGLVGGTGPESTVMYYKELNSKIDEATGGKSMPELAIESVNFRKAWELVSQEKHKELADYLSGKIKNLAEGGAEIIALTAATMHIVFDEVVKQTNVSLVSIPKTICSEVIERGYKKVGLLGTIFTMEQDFMKKDLLQAGIDVVVPDKVDRELIAKRIYEELELGIVKESTLQEFNEIIQRMRNEHKIEAVILGCTELPLILNDENCVLPCLDSVAIHIKKLVELAQE